MRSSDCECVMIAQHTLHTHMHVHVVHVHVHVHGLHDLVPVKYKH